MARRCQLTGKGPRSGHNVSHSNRKSNRRFNPNIQKVRAVLENGTHRRVRVCTRCLRSGKVKKPGRTTRPEAKTSAA